MPTRAGRGGSGPGGRQGQDQGEREQAPQSPGPDVGSVGAHAVLLSALIDHGSPYRQNAYAAPAPVPLGVSWPSAPAIAVSPSRATEYPKKSWRCPSGATRWA